jgi:AraC-like DNA-binding protein
MRVNEEHVTHPGQALRVLHLEQPSFAGPRHRHAQVELTWVRRGRGLRFVGDNTAPFEDGDLVLLGPEVPHLWTGEAGPGEAPFAATVLQFPVALLASPLLPELAVLRPLVETARRGLAVRGDCHAQVTALLAQSPGADPLAQLATLVQVLRVLHQHQHSDALLPLASPWARRGREGDKPTGPEQGSNSRIDRVTDWIHQHLAGALPVRDAADLAHVTPAAFSRFFKRETGKTFSAYVSDVRCSEACLQLRRSARPVALVAEDCGFRSLSHFNREFRARFGTTPRAYRQALPGASGPAPV